MTEQGRFNPAPLGRRILARSVRLTRAGGARFAAQAVARHRNPTLGRRPRLMPVQDVLPSDPGEHAPPVLPEPVAQPASAVPRPGGISEEAARWLFLGELGPTMLPMSALKPAPPRVARKLPRTAIPRARIEEGPSVRSAPAGAPLARSPRESEIREPAGGGADGRAGDDRPADPGPGSPAEVLTRGRQAVKSPAGSRATSRTRAIATKSRRPSASPEPRPDATARKPAESGEPAESESEAEPIGGGVGGGVGGAGAGAGAGRVARSPEDLPGMTSGVNAPAPASAPTAAAAMGEQAAPAGEPLRRLRPAGPARRVARKGMSADPPVSGLVGRPAGSPAAGSPAAGDPASQAVAGPPTVGRNSDIVRVSSQAGLGGVAEGAAPAARRVARTPAVDRASGAKTESAAGADGSVRRSAPEPVASGETDGTPRHYGEPEGSAPAHGARGGAAGRPAVVVRSSAGAPGGEASAPAGGRVVARAVDPSAGVSTIAPGKSDDPPSTAPGRVVSGAADTSASVSAPASEAVARGGGEGTPSDAPASEDRPVVAMRSSATAEPPVPGQVGRPEGSLAAGDPASHAVAGPPTVGRNSDIVTVSSQAGLGGVAEAAAPAARRVARRPAVARASGAETESAAGADGSVLRSAPEPIASGGEASAPVVGRVVARAADTSASVSAPASEVVARGGSEGPPIDGPASEDRPVVAMRSSATAPPGGEASASAVGGAVARAVDPSARVSTPAPGKSDDPSSTAPGQVVSRAVDASAGVSALALEAPAPVVGRVVARSVDVPVKTDGTADAPVASGGSQAPRSHGGEPESSAADSRPRGGAERRPVVAVRSSEAAHGGVASAPLVGGVHRDRGAQDAWEESRNYRDLLPKRRSEDVDDPASTVRGRVVSRAVDASAGAPADRPVADVDRRAGSSAAGSGGSGGAEGRPAVAVRSSDAAPTAAASAPSAGGAVSRSVGTSGKASAPADAPVASGGSETARSHGREPESSATDSRPSGGTEGRPVVAVRSSASSPAAGGVVSRSADASAMPSSPAPGRSDDSPSTGVGRVVARSADTPVSTSAPVAGVERRAARPAAAPAASARAEPDDPSSAPVGRVVSRSTDGSTGATLAPSQVPAPGRPGREPIQPPGGRDSRPTSRGRFRLAPARARSRLGARLTTEQLNAALPVANDIADIAGATGSGRPADDSPQLAPGAGTPARSRVRTVTRAALGWQTNPHTRAALRSHPALRVSRRAAASGIAPVAARETRPLVRADTSITVRQPQPPASPAMLPAAATHGRPSGESLARAIGVPSGSDGSGRSTVVFPQLPKPATQRGPNGGSRLLARRTVEMEAPALPGQGPQDRQSAATETSMYDAGQFDELYDRVLSRLRRDLIIERERRGDLAGAYFRY
jgi:hypothetical protein